MTRTTGKLTTVLSGSLAGLAIVAALAGLGGCGGSDPTRGELSEEARAAVLKKRVDVQDRSKKAGRKGGAAAPRGGSH